MATIQQPLDFYGCNIYRGIPIRAGEAGGLEVVPPPQGGPRTTMRWPVNPECLYWGPRFFHERYGLPVYVTENGVASMDWVGTDGSVSDGARIDFLRQHLGELSRAVAEGVDVRGYFHWTIMDNFEWAEGYQQRFGLIYVDYQSQKRVLKESAHWYGSLLRSGGTLYG